MRLFSVLLVLLISACTTGTDPGHLRQDVNGLKRDFYDVQREIDSLKEKTGEAVKEDSFSAVRENQAELNSRLSDISMSLQELRGRFEENRYFLEKILKASATERDFLRAQIAGIENQVRLLKGKFGLTEGLAETQAPIIKKWPEVSKTDSIVLDMPEHTKADIEKQEQVREEKDVLDNKTKDYEAAYQAFKDKRYREAGKRFEAFIKDYPRNELTDNAQFWIAETYYVEKDYEGAILAYEALLKNYSDSEKISGALLKQGFAFIEIGDKKTGRIILEKLIEKFPDSKGAEVATKKLNAIDKR